MKRGLPIIVLLCVLLMAFGLRLIFSPHSPRDLLFWANGGAGQDWSAAATRGDAQAEFFRGFAMVRSNLVIYVDEVGPFCHIPVLGKLFFRHVSYGLNTNGGNPQDLAEAYKWIKQSADKGFAPAKEAQMLFIGKVTLPANNGAATVRTN